MSHVEAAVTYAPGSRMHAAESAAVQAGPDVEVNYSPAPVVEEKFVVEVREKRASHTTYRTAVIPANSFGRILGRNDQRRQVTLLNGSQKIILCDSKEMAGEVNNMAIGAGTPVVPVPGAWVTANDNPFTIGTTGELWGVALNSAAWIGVIEEWWDD